MQGGQWDAGVGQRQCRGLAMKCRGQAMQGSGNGMPGLGTRALPGSGTTCNMQGSGMMPGSGMRGAGLAQGGGMRAQGRGGFGGGVCFVAGGAVGHGCCCLPTATSLSTPSSVHLE
eukprot:3386980-Rhodomonas_salina.1